MSDYKLARRTHYQRSDRPLSGWALDVTIRQNKDGTYFLSDHNDPNHTDAMPHTTLADLEETLHNELQRHTQEHFGRKP